jgi:uncharacterized protein involved in exopolysaccharide biosynthesis
MNEQNLRTDQSQAITQPVTSGADNATMFGVTGLVIHVLTQLASRKRMILSVTGAAMFGGLLLSLLLPVRYTAVTKIMPPRQTQSTTAILNSVPGLGAMGDAMSGGLNLRDPNSIYVALMQSRPIAEAIIDRFNLMQVYGRKNRTDTRQELADNTEIVSEMSTLISISVTDKDRKRAAGMANAYIEQLRTLSKTISVTEASRRRLFYEEQLKQAREALVTAELAFQQVQQQKGLVQLDAQAKTMLESLAAFRAQIAAKEVEVQALRSYSTEQNPDVQLAERELTSLQAEETSLEQRKNVPGIAGLGLGNVPAAGLDYLRAAHELQYQQALNDMLMKQYEAAKLDEAKEAAVIQVVEPAIEPERKSSPHRLEIVLLSTIGGFLASCFLTWALWWRGVARTDPETAAAIQNLQGALRRPI